MRIISFIILFLLADRYSFCQEIFPPDLTTRDTRPVLVRWFD